MNDPSTLNRPKMPEALSHPAAAAARAVPGGVTGWKGVLLHIHIAPAASQAMEELREAECVAGRDGAGGPALGLVRAS